jgi:23S rRNA A2030 N6-methylase RlmJ
MADQTKNAGNIGDVVKHAIVPAAAEVFGHEHPGGWVYAETHAGFYDYLTPGGWKGEQKRAVGVIEQSGRVAELGPYGRVLANCLATGVYPGSIRIVDEAFADLPSLTGIYGRDVGDEQVDSFQGRSSRVHVGRGDGYEIASALPPAPRLILADPFWDDPAELNRVQRLLGGEPSVMVWYPLSRRSEAFRVWHRNARLCSVELAFAFHDAANGWAGQDQKGAGLAFQGIPPAGFDRVVGLARILQSVFAGRTVSYAGGDRDVSLDLRVFQGRSGT